MVGACGICQATAPQPASSLASPCPAENWDIWEQHLSQDTCILLFLLPSSPRDGR